MANDLDPIPTDPIISIKITNELSEKVEAASRQTGLKKADVMRLGMDRGIDVLIAQLTTPALAATLEDDA